MTTDRQLNHRSGLWTATGPDGTVATLCEEHALASSNVALEICGYPPVDSVAEAVAIVDMHMALRGVDEEWISFSTEGECETCARTQTPGGGGSLDPTLATGSPLEEEEA